MTYTRTQNDRRAAIARHEPTRAPSEGVRGASAASVTSRIGAMGALLASMGASAPTVEFMGETLKPSYVLRALYRAHVEGVTAETVGGYRVGGAYVRGGAGIAIRARESAESERVTVTYPIYNRAAEVAASMGALWQTATMRDVLAELIREALIACSSAVLVAPSAPRRQSSHGREEDARNYQIGRPLEDNYLDSLDSSLLERGIARESTRLADTRAAFLWYWREYRMIERASVYQPPTLPTAALPHTIPTPRERERVTAAMRERAERRAEREYGKRANASERETLARERRDYADRETLAIQRASETPRETPSERRQRERETRANAARALVARYRASAERAAASEAATTRYREGACCAFVPRAAMLIDTSERYRDATAARDADRRAELARQRFARQHARRQETPPPEVAPPLDMLIPTAETRAAALVLATYRDRRRRAELALAAAERDKRY